MGYELLALYFSGGFFTRAQQSAQLTSVVSTSIVLLKEAQLDAPTSMLDRSHFFSLVGQFFLSP